MQYTLVNFQAENPNNEYIPYWKNHQNKNKFDRYMKLRTQMVTNVRIKTPKNYLTKRDNEKLIRPQTEQTPPIFQKKKHSLSINLKKVTGIISEQSERDGRVIPLATMFTPKSKNSF